MPDSPGLFTWTPPVAPPGIGTQTVTDNFDRANQTPISGNWTPTTHTTGRIDIQSNQLVCLTGSGNDAEAYYNAWSSGNDQYSQVEISGTGTSAGAGMGPCVRHIAAAGTQTMYRLVMDAAGNYELASFVAGSIGSLRTGTVTFSAGTKLGLSVQGTTLKIWYGGVQVGADATSSAVSTGNPGVAYSSVLSTIRGDNWDAGTVP